MSKVYIIMGSKSDIVIAQQALDILNGFGVNYKVHIASAHRTPLKIDEIVADAERDECPAIIAVAGMAAHLPGVIASKTLIPVIGVPVSSRVVAGQDALLSIVQMPPGIPVACMAINGAKNAAVYAIQIMANTDVKLKGKLELYRVDMAKEVEKVDSELNELGMYSFRKMYAI